MSRNSSGVYTLPTGNPVVSGTVIQSSWANDTMSDVAAALTDSLSRSGEGGMTAALRIVDGTVATPGLAFGNETGSGLYRTGVGAYSLGVLGNPVFGLTSAGASVTGTLGVSGTVSLTGQFFQITNSSAYYPQIINRNNATDATSGYLVLDKNRGGLTVQNGDYLGSLAFRGWDGASYLEGSVISAVVDATPGTNDMPTSLRFSTTPDGAAGPSERMRITSTGNVGIGTASPISKLTVNGGVMLSAGAGASGSYFFPYYISETNFNAIGSASNGSMTFFSGVSGSAERMRIDPSGNVGIGTSSPAAPLHVVGNAFVQGGNVYADNLITYNGSSSLGLVAGNAAITFQTNSLERMRIAADGRVAVNSSLLGAAFTVKSFSDAYQYGGVGIVSSDDAIWNILQASTHDLYFGWNYEDKALVSVVDGTWVSISDRRKKKDVSDCQYGLAEVLKLRPVKYLMLEEEEGAKKHLGFIAQEVNEVVVEAVNEFKNEDQMLGLNYSSLIPVLVRAIQELKAEVDALKGN